MYLHDRDPFSAELDACIQSLEPIPGVCILIDVIDSVADKYRPPERQWIKKLNNTFNFISLINRFSEYLVKGIGDEILLYIPLTAFQADRPYPTVFSLLAELRSTMATLREHPFPQLFYPCKIGLHLCFDVYNISFVPHTNDYYGRDIDVVCRLMKKATAGEIVLSETLYQHIVDESRAFPEQTPALLPRCGKTVKEAFKGVPEPVAYRLLTID